ncbi:DMT family transporter [Spirosoma utsteinense]|uniref:Drug/metabolite transporter (DMT)-like permease n=1 Tax=Spirosoma utsteinense TaxID=2585773 RepID=A0ABR6W011_9BACT|nr:DMT family transporter [Spirosoma utsteinense]MBC3786845.1 drug/metabolite transporter (DMT)-like permease [Spirosoma utsteinense]MBC3789860.1 drug/metabolite transporter (DMT)-like permease [Spirosoma utsteinense]
MRKSLPANTVPGLLFAALWASASVATKFGVQSVHPLILANVRFFIAGTAMLAFAYGLQPTKSAWPTRAEFKQLAIFALLNTTIYLGAFVLALKQVSAGIGSLSTATNPLFIALLSALWLRRIPGRNEIGGLLLGIVGVGVATYPLLQNSFATIEGLLILLAGMVSVSAATVYYAGIDWRLSNLVINGWQVLLGGIQLLPFTLLFADFGASHYDGRFWASVFWLILPVSVAALQLWFYLIRQNPVGASLWLFLCPIFGFVYSYFLMGEPITLYTLAGTALVIGGLWLGRRK